MFTQSMIERIQQQSHEIERIGALSTELLQIAFEQKLFKLFVPVELGGRMLGLPEALRVFQEASFIDGSFGWLVTIGSGGNMFVSNFEQQYCEALFSPSEAVIAGSGHPSGRAIKTTSGYLVTGEWNYCSGASYASMFTANSIVVEEGEESEGITSCIFLPEQVEVVEDWNAFGLKGTGSHTIKVENAFVPFDRTFSIFETKNNYGGPVHSFPFEQFSQSSFAAVCLGIGQGFLHEARKNSELNKERWIGMGKYEMISTLIEERLNRFQETEQLFHTTVDTLWKSHIQGSALQEADLQQFSQICKDSAATTIDCTNVLFRHFGMEAVMESSSLNRIWRNLHTAGQHTFLTRS